MTSPFSGLVLGSGALLASPALRAAFVDGTMSIDTAIVRLVVAVLVSWIGLSLLTSLLDGTAAPSTDVDETPRALPGIDGPIPVRGAVIDNQDGAQEKPAG
jgi:hypothetical protein